MSLSETTLNVITGIGDRLGSFTVVVSEVQDSSKSVSFQKFDSSVSESSNKSVVTTNRGDSAGNRESEERWDIKVRLRESGESPMTGVFRNEGLF